MGLNPGIPLDALIDQWLATIGGVLMVGIIRPAFAAIRYANHIPDFPNPKMT